MSEYYEQQNVYETGHQTKSYNDNSAYQMKRRGQNYNQNSFENSRRHYQYSKKPETFEYARSGNRSENKRQWRQKLVETTNLTNNLKKRQQQNNKRVQDMHLNLVDYRQPNARKQELQMKMNNINMLNDKINNLLSLVKRDKPEQSPKDKQIQRTEKQMQRSPTHYKQMPNYLKQRTPTRINEQPNQSPQAEVKYQINNSKQSNRIVQAQAPKLDLKQSNKSIKRLRTLSLLSPNLGNSQQDYDKYEVELNNEVNNILRSPSKKGKELFSNNSSQYSAQRTDKNRKNSHSPFYDQKEKYKSPKIQQQQIRLKNPQHVSLKYQQKHSPKDHNPTTPTTNKKREQSQQKYTPNYKGLKMIDDQIKRIKEYNEANNSIHSQLPDKHKQPIKHIQEKYQVGKDTFQFKVMPVQIDRDQTIKIAEKLSEQINLDNRMKKAILALSKSMQKLEDLQQKINQFGIRMTLAQIKELIEISQKQSSNSDYQQSSKNQRWSSVQQVNEAQQFWEHEVKGCAIWKILKKQGFNGSELDQQRKGYLTIEDVTSFVNKYTGHSHQNRELSFIFRRLQHLEGSQNSIGISISTFLQTFST